MFTADARLQGWARSASALATNTYKLAHAILIDRDERVLREDAVLNIGREELARVIP